MNIQIFGSASPSTPRRRSAGSRSAASNTSTSTWTARACPPGSTAASGPPWAMTPWWTGTAPTTGSWGLTIFCPRRRRRSCWKTPGCSGRPSSATAARPPWATAPTCGKPGNKGIIPQKSAGGQPRRKNAQKNRSAPADLFFLWSEAITCWPEPCRQQPFPGRCPGASWR